MEIFAELDFETFLKAAVNGVPLMFVIIGLVEWSKSFKNKAGEQAIQGNGLLILSMSLGVLFGTGYMLVQTRPPQSADWYVHFVYWFGVITYSLALGLSGSGLYNMIRNKINELFKRLGYDVREVG